jgi:outer membrane protein assembly factor BamA
MTTVVFLAEWALRSGIVYQANPTLKTQVVPNPYPSSGDWRYPESMMARILIIAVCLCASGVPLLSQAQNATPQPQQQPAQPEQNQKNPFESIPPVPPQAAVGPGVIEGVDFRGSRRSPQDTLRETIFSKVGDTYNEDAVRRDVMALRSTNRFDDVRVSTEEGKKGGVILHFVVTDRLATQ